MPLESPKLDDLTFDALTERLRAQIPVHAPEWTNHNESDPGITLIQLFAHLAEQIGYRLNQVPEKNYIEFLKLVGIRLRPARAATTLLEFILSKPEAAAAFTLPAGARVKAKSGEKPSFELDAEMAGVPAQLAGLVTTRHAELTQINGPGESGPALSSAVEAYVAERFALVWDGKTPKLKELPSRPLPLFRATAAAHRHLWVALAFNPSPAAGFLGQRVSLRVQLDDDEQPDARAVVDGRASLASLTDLVNAAGDAVGYAYYSSPQPGQAGSFRPLRVLSDDTDGWTRSGTIRFDVPSSLGPIADSEWQDVATTPETVVHPLPGALKIKVQGTPSKVPVSGWLRVSFAATVPAASLRALSFNVAAASHAQLVSGEMLGLGTGLPGQRASLSHRNVLDQTLRLAVVDLADGLFHDWREVGSFDAAGPFDTVFVLDREAGLLAFGDGLRGKPPPLRARIVAVSYRHGGGVAGEVDAGLVNQAESLPSVVSDAVNIVAARGGRDAETQEQARLRGPSSIKTRERAVTAEDFEFLALQTSGVRIARVIVVPLRAPLPTGSPHAPGLDVNTTAAGVVSLVIVPEARGLFPTPTESMLLRVCQHLNAHRLLTTELYAVAPQYVRLFELEVIVVAAAGYSRSQLRESIAARLETYFHVLTGGPEGHGFGFGALVHHADLVSQVFRVAGVERVEAVSASFDGRAPEPEPGVERMSWRPERAEARRLTNCPVAPEDTDQIVLLSDETVFVDTTTLNVIVR